MTFPLAPLLAARDRGRVAWLGLMSGTSCDGIDLVRVVLVETGDGPRVEELSGTTAEFTVPFRAELGRALAGPGSFEDAARFDRALGERFAAAARSGIERLGPVDAIALSGHTFAHLPAEDPPTTLQLGSPSIVAEMTGIPVVAGFRSADVARGGEGAPLVPMGDRVLFRALGDPLAVINVGGISNVTWLAGGEEPRAADAGPGNLLLDGAFQRGVPDGEGFDRDGRTALSGRVVPALLHRWMHDEHRSSSRRSYGREEYGERWLEQEEGHLAEHSLADRLATVCAWIAEEVARTIDQLGGGRHPMRTLLGGGGAHHERLVAELGDRLRGKPVEILTAESHGVDADLREAAAFAILGHEWLYGRPGSCPGTTGARAAGPLGGLFIPGETRRELAEGPDGP